MGLLDKLKFHLWDDVGTVTAALERWRPRKCTSEKDYERSLYEYLHKTFPDLQITKQFSRGRVKADLAVENRVIVEIKYNLDSTSKYQRLLGQIADYKEWDGKCIILLAGETEPNLLKELRRYLVRERLSADLWGGITLFEK